VALLGYGAIDWWRPQVSGRQPERTVTQTPSATHGSLTPLAAAPGGTDVASAAAGPVLEPNPRLLAGRLVVLDPGHNRDNGQHLREIRRQVDAGGFLKDCNTTGTEAAGLAESTVNWRLADVVAHRLRQLGARVVLTRDGDAGWGPCIDERAALANRLRADVLLSIHADGAPPTDHGFHVIRPGLVPGYTDDVLDASRALATSLRDALVDAGLTPSTYRGDEGLDERTDLGTLNRSDVPVAMVECGNMHNAADFALLRDGRERLAAALVEGLVENLTRSPPR
jgi:N-acetylmuramoyl-L-alanine amidase